MRQSVDGIRGLGRKLAGISRRSYGSSETSQRLIDQQQDDDNREVSLGINPGFEKI
jgi:hypothetical protein